MPKHDTAESLKRRAEAAERALHRASASTDAGIRALAEQNEEKRRAVIAFRDSRLHAEAIRLRVWQDCDPHLAQGWLYLLWGERCPAELAARRCDALAAPSFS